MYYVMLHVCAGSLLYHCINVGLLYTYLASGSGRKETQGAFRALQHGYTHQDDWIDWR